jgi:hypothetical protein
LVVTTDLLVARGSLFGVELPFWYNLVPSAKAGRRVVRAKVVNCMMIDLVVERC